MKRRYQEFKFRKETLEIIAKANAIIDEYHGQGFDLTLRQLYYQFVARGFIENSLKSYKNLGNIINNARLNGNIDWDAIRDRTRKLQGNSHWGDPSDIIASSAYSYRLNTRDTQDTHLEVWVEKEALVGVIQKAAVGLDVDFFACRGYVSQSAMYEASRRFHRSSASECVILHLGDHDPSGIDMTRDIEDRLNNTFQVPTTIKRIALNMDQVEQYSPPPNPAKLTDSRVGGYISRFGEQSWELDALEPRVIIDLINKEAAKYTDEEARQLLIDRQEQERRILQLCSDNWDDVADFIKENHGDEL